LALLQGEMWEVWKQKNNAALQLEDRGEAGARRDAPACGGPKKRPTKWGKDPEKRKGGEPEKTNLLMIPGSGPTSPRPENKRGAARARREKETWKTTPVDKKFVGYRPRSILRITGPEGEAKQDQTGFVGEEPLMNGHRLHTKQTWGGGKGK